MPDVPKPPKHKRTRRPNRLSPAAFKALCWDMYSKGRDTCEVCGIGLVWPDMEWNHIINKSQGGGDTEDNLDPLCWPCHRIHHS